jgi:uncharacterized membrane protein
MASFRMGTGRLEAFSDGVFAIAATLLILSVGTQLPRGGAGLGAALLHAWPSYVAYAVSFLTIGIIWANHHTLMAQVGRVDRAFLIASVVFLMVIAFIPFPTQVIADHIRDDGARAAALTYGLTMTLTAVMFNVIWFAASRRGRLLREDADPAVVRGITRSYLPGPWIYLAATLVALVAPILAAALFAAIAIFYAVESSVFGRG